MKWKVDDLEEALAKSTGPSTLVHKAPSDEAGEVLHGKEEEEEGRRNSARKEEELQALRSAYEGRIVELEGLVGSLRHQLEVSCAAQSVEKEQVVHSESRSASDIESLQAQVAQLTHVSVFLIFYPLFHHSSLLHPHFTSLVLSNSNNNNNNKSNSRSAKANS